MRRIRRLTKKLAKKFVDAEYVTVQYCGAANPMTGEVETLFEIYVDDLGDHPLADELGCRTLIETFPDYEQCRKYIKSL